MKKIPLTALRVVQPPPVAAITYKALLDCGYHPDDILDLQADDLIRPLAHHAAYEVLSPEILDIPDSDEVVSIVELVRAARGTP